MKNTKQTKCACCGTPERIRRHVRRLVTNICRALGLCGDCLMEGKG